MADELQGKTIAFVVLPEEANDVELAEPWDSVKNAGGTPKLLSTQSLKISLDQGGTSVTAGLVSEARPANYDGLVLPGDIIPARRSTEYLVKPPEWWESNNDAVCFVDLFYDLGGKPIWIPVTEADFDPPPPSGKKWTHKEFGAFVDAFKR